ncbi:histidine kinase [Lentzea sp. CA-135723]|uniref:sensor histidine kinase n=1 Tax=Lentzea sp. CA-135723 TaxID=3239950 RepID=UPI003D8F6734
MTDHLPGPGHSTVSRRLAFAVVSVVFANYLLNAFLYVLDAGATPARVAGSLACLATIGYLQLGVFSRPGTDLTSPRAFLALGVLAVLVFAPVVFFSTAWAGMPGFLAGSSLLVLRGRVRWVVFALVAVANPVTKTWVGAPLGVQAYWLVSTATAGLAVYGLSRLPTLVDRLETARSELADLAVARERLGFARDLEDLLGQGLTTIIQTTRAGGEAAIARILGIARAALADVRSVASSYRDPPSPPAPIPALFPRVLLTAVVIGYCVMAALLASFDLRVMAVCAVSGAVIAALVLGIVVRSGPRYLALAGIALCVFGPQLVTGNPFTGGVPGFAAGAALLVLPRRLGWVAFGAVVASQGVVHAVAGNPLTDVVWGMIAATNHGLVLYALTKLWSMVTELQRAREELAAAAVTRERLRFARDLHDLLGYSLSAITLKTELAHRLAPEQARRELAEVRGIARQALADVRSVALSYRELSFDEELRSARNLLAAADVEVGTRIDAGELPVDVKVTLATVLREGVTNLLRHSKAEHCEIELSTSGRLAALEIVNDGVPAAAPKSGDGSGIGNLTTRVRALGGDLHAGLTPEHTFRLRAEIPLPRQSISMTAQPQL